jgi:transposase
VVGAGHERAADREAGFYQRGPGAGGAAQFQRRRFDSVYPRYRGGRPPQFTLAQRREIKKIAKSKPAEHGLPFSRWSLAKLADFLVAEGVVEDISHEGLRELLRAEGVSFSIGKDLEVIS